jgi:hypothetical protein
MSYIGVQVKKEVPNQINNVLTVDGLNSSSFLQTSNDQTISEVKIFYIPPKNASSEPIKFPSGSTSQRPSNVINGLFRYNSQLKKFEYAREGQWLSLLSKSAISGYESQLVSLITDLTTAKNNATTNRGTIEYFLSGQPTGINADRLNGLKASDFLQVSTYQTVKGVKTFINANPEFNSTGRIQLPVGTLASRPQEAHSLRFNTEISQQQQPQYEILINGDWRSLLTSSQVFCKNLIENPTLEIAQRSGVNGVTATPANSNTFFADRWVRFISGNCTLQWNLTTSSSTLNPIDGSNISATFTITGTTGGVTIRQLITKERCQYFLGKHMMLSFDASVAGPDVKIAALAYFYRGYGAPDPKRILVDNSYKTVTITNPWRRYDVPIYIPKQLTSDQLGVDFDSGLVIEIVLVDNSSNDLLLKGNRIIGLSNIALYESKIPLIRPYVNAFEELQKCRQYFHGLGRFYRHYPYVGSVPVFSFMYVPSTVPLRFSPQSPKDIIVYLNPPSNVISRTAYSHINGISVFFQLGPTPNGISYDAVHHETLLSRETEVLF